MSGHQFENERWFRRSPLELLDALLLIPCALRLVKNDDMLMRRRLRRATKTILEKVIDVLDSSAHFSTDNPKRHSLFPSAITPHILISRQSLAKHDDQGRVAREIDDITISLDASRYGAMNNMEPCESLARARYARQDQQESLLLLTRLFNQRYKSSGC